MSRAAYQWPTLGRVLPDVAAFAIGLGTAWLLEWKTTDLVWSLWLGSLVLGYLTILSTVAAGVYIGIMAICHAEFPRKHRLPAVLIGSAAALFFLGFFSLHFCGFHAGHAIFLSSFFPVAGLPTSAFSDAFMNPLLLWRIVFRHLLTVYGVFLIPAVIAERGHVFASITAAVKAVRGGIPKHSLQEFMQSGKGRDKAMRDPFIRPYVNVIRMHILIFFFALSYMLKAESFFVYAVVYLAYFFPWKAFRKEEGDILLFRSPAEHAGLASSASPVTRPQADRPRKR